MYCVPCWLLTELFRVLLFILFYFCFVSSSSRETRLNGVAAAIVEGKLDPHWSLVCWAHKSLFVGNRSWLGETTMRTLDSVVLVFSGRRLQYPRHLFGHLTRDSSESTITGRSNFLATWPRGLQKTNGRKWWAKLIRSFHPAESILRWDNIFQFLQSTSCGWIFAYTAYYLLGPVWW